MTFPLRAEPELLQLAAKAGLLVLDIDGVLLDPRPSFYEAARETSLWAATLALGRSPGPAVTDDEIRAFKAVGGWNDDFELACGCAWALVARESLRSHPSVSETANASGPGGLVPFMRKVGPSLPTAVSMDAATACAPSVVRDRCAARYSGLDRCREMYGIDPALHADLPAEGLWPLEPVLADPHVLKASGFDLAFFTGRNSAEADLAAIRFGLSIPSSRRIVDDGIVPRKPAPEGLLALGAQSSGPLVFIGDSIDDQRASLAYRVLAEGSKLPPIVFIRVLGDDAKEAEITAASDAGADAVTPGLDAFLRALPPRYRRDDE